MCIFLEICLLGVLSLNLVSWVDWLSLVIRRRANMSPIFYTRIKHCLFKKLKKSYEYRILETCLHGVVWLNLVWVCIVECLPWPEMGSRGRSLRLPISGQGRHSTIHRGLSLVIGHQANMSPIIYTYEFFSSIVEFNCRIGLRR